MDIGMLWRDEDERRTLDEKVLRAADYYRNKYGENPTVCFVHPSMVPSGKEKVAGIRLLTARTVLLNHFWLGVNDAPGAQRMRAKGAAST
jgi:hypothetical protein